MPSSLPDFREILGVLTEHEVDFIVVGGLCAILHGAPINTADVDIVHARQPANIDRLLSALKVLDAHYREHTKKIAPTRSHLASPGHQLLTTRAGPLDVLGTIADGLGYDELRTSAVSTLMEIGLSVKILTLEKLIEVKEHAGRPKDHAVLFQLRAVLKERQEKASDFEPS
jgi:predicted nucleotidyltransferase